MQQTFILKDNSEEIRRKIQDAGIDVCPCAAYPESDWLEYSTFVANGVHGEGYPFEWMTKEETRALFLKEVENPVWCKDTEEFIRLIKESQQKPQP